ncbi:T9SS type A sorting domain-containing protein [Bacteroidota bacterium]
MGGGGYWNTGKILRTNNGGNQWDEIFVSSNYVPRFYTIFFINGNLGWTAGSEEWIFRTTDGGITWESIAYFGYSDISNLLGIYFLDSLTGFVCGYENHGTGNISGPIYKTSDGGFSWYLVASVGYGAFGSLAYCIGTNSLYAVGNGGSPYGVGQIRKSTDIGNNWFEIECPTTEYLNRVTFTENKGWIVGRNGTILTSLVSSSVEETDYLSEFNLLQNYPNPFNPNTTIKYQVPELTFVTIKVYDVLGNEIVTLVNEEKPAGSYEVEFDAANLPNRQGSALTSGIYFYQLKAGDYVETKKMVLLK